MATLKKTPRKSFIEKIIAFETANKNQTKDCVTKKLITNKRANTNLQHNANEKFEENKKQEGKEKSGRNQKLVCIKKGKVKAKEKSERKTLHTALPKLVCIKKSKITPNHFWIVEEHSNSKVEYQNQGFFPLFYDNQNANHAWKTTKILFHANKLEGVFKIAFSNPDCRKVRKTYAISIDEHSKVILYFCSIEDGIENVNKIGLDIVQNMKYCRQKCHTNELCSVYFKLCKKNESLLDFSNVMIPYDEQGKYTL